MSLAGFPNQIRVVIGTGWTVNAPFSEDNIIILTKVPIEEYTGAEDGYAYYVAGDFADYSEDGTLISGVTNRLIVTFSSGAVISPMLAARVRANTVSDSWRLAGTGLVLSGGPGYSFLEIFSDTAAMMTLGGDTYFFTSGITYSPGVFKSMAESTSAVVLSYVDDLTVSTTITSLWLLTTDDMTVSTAIDGPLALTQKHTLAVDDMTVETRIMAPWILEPDDMSVSVTMDSPTLVQAQDLQYIPPMLVLTKISDVKLVPVLVVQNMTVETRIEDGMYLDVTILNPVGVASISIPMMTVSAYTGAQASISIPMMTVSASALVGVTASVGLSVPMMTVESKTGATASISIPMMTVSAEADNGLSAQAEITIPMMTVSAVATVNQVASAEIAIPMMTVAASAVVGGVSDAAITIPMMRVSARALVGLLAEAEITIPMITVEASSYEIITYDADISIPMMTVLARALVDRFAEYVLRYSRW